MQLQLLIKYYCSFYLKYFRRQNVNFRLFLFPDGHALSKKFAKQVKNCDKRLKEMLIQYNSSWDSLSIENRWQLRELQVSDLGMEVERLLMAVEDDTDVAAQIPHSIRHQAIDMLHLRDGVKRKLNLSKKK